ncbi:MAG: DNA helicase, partial [Acidobacteria bacterium]|nr:DNA helicase [Acidobacteriota bacterium]
MAKGCPMQQLNLKPTHKPVAEYYRALRQFKAINVSHETAVRDAFQDLLKSCCTQFGWTLVPEWPIRRAARHALRVDGALVDEYRLTHGYWEAKDEADDLQKEVRKKFDAGYPKDNILFQAPERAILWQNGRQVLDED